MRRVVRLSIWGKVIGGVAGFALGGPLGGLLGAVAGHALDRMRAGGAGAGADTVAARQVAFTIAVIALAAKIGRSRPGVTARGHASGGDH